MAVPDPGALFALAARWWQGAQEVRALAARVDSLVGLTWEGRAAAGYRRAVRARAEDLRALAARYEEVACDLDARARSAGGGHG